MITRMTRALGSLALALGMSAAALAADIPRPSPNLAISLPGGQQIHLEQYRGKVVALAFISTT